MNTLANTTWNVISPEASMIISFSPEGTAKKTFPDGMDVVGAWAETPDGHFMVQWPDTGKNEHVNDVIFGVYNGAEGSGLNCNSDTSLANFTMKKQ